MLRALETSLEARRSAPAENELVDLANHAIAFADGRPAEDYGDDTAFIIDKVSAADVVVLASPVYRGTFTGALKNLLDHMPPEALCGKPVGIVAMGATHHHYLGVDWHLRDVLAWFGAIVAPTSVYLSSKDFVDGAPSEDARRELSSLIDALWKLREIAPKPGESLGPRPLASRRD